MSIVYATDLSDLYMASALAELAAPHDFTSPPSISVKVEKDEKIEIRVSDTEVAIITESVQVEALAQKDQPSSEDSSQVQHSEAEVQVDTNPTQAELKQRTPIQQDLPTEDPLPAVQRSEPLKEEMMPLETEQAVLQPTTEQQVVDSTVAEMLPSVVPNDPPTSVLPLDPPQPLVPKIEETILTPQTTEATTETSVQVEQGATDPQDGNVSVDLILLLQEKNGHSSQSNLSLQEGKNG